MYDSDYIDTPEYEKDRHSQTMLRFRRRQFVYSFLFLIGTVAAAIGWFLEWKALLQSSLLLWLPLAGHALQVIGAFGSLLTPDYLEEDENN